MFSAGSTTLQSRVHHERLIQSLSALPSRRRDVINPAFDVCGMRLNMAMLLDAGWIERLSNFVRTDGDGEIGINFDKYSDCGGNTENVFCCFLSLIP